MSEIKEILESTVTRAEVDPNRLHQEELRGIAKAWPVDDAVVVAEELAKKHPTVMFMALSARMDEINIALSDVKHSLEVLNNANS